MLDFLFSKVKVMVTKKILPNTKILQKVLKIFTQTKKLVRNSPIKIKITPLASLIDQFVLQNWRIVTNFFSREDNCTLLFLNFQLIGKITLALENCLRIFDHFFFK